MPTMGDQNDTTGTYRLAVRFGDEILQAGFTTVPNLLLRYQAILGISSSEFNFILQVWYHWWDQKDPYPALGTIAERIGQSRRQVRRYSESLRDKGFLIVRERREPGLCVCQPGMAHFDAREWPTPVIVPTATVDGGSVGRLTAVSQA